MSDLDTQFAEVIGQLDDEHLLLVLLMAHALKRKDMGLNDALEAYSHIPRHDCDDATCEVDFDLLGQIKTVCPDDESLTWGRALTQCVIRGDQSKAAALQDLMRRRVSN
jgi:hypothetical protein